MFSPQKLRRRVASVSAKSSAKTSSIFQQLQVGRVVLKNGDVQRLPVGKSNLVLENLEV